MPLALLQTRVAGVCNTVDEPSEDILLVRAVMSEMCMFRLVETSDRYLSTDQSQQIGDCSQPFLDLIDINSVQIFLLTKMAKKVG